MAAQDYCPVDTVTTSRPEQPPLSFLSLGLRQRVFGEARLWIFSTPS
jgi:hypothetical protein